MVRLKLPYIKESIKKILSFNSSMVRLKLTVNHGKSIRSMEFQFLYGAIKTIL